MKKDWRILRAERNADQLGLVAPAGEISMDIVGEVANEEKQAVLPTPHIMDTEEYYNPTPCLPRRYVSVLIF